MFTLTVNGVNHSVEATADTPLLWVLRDIIGMTGTKFGCGVAQCGACTVLVDDRPVRACVMAVGRLGQRRVSTIEGMSDDPVGHTVQAAWIQTEVVQCGYCQAGQIMSATALLKSNPTPDDQQIDAAMAGNICRCGTYGRIRQAIHVASGRLGENE